ncbi:MULTISPECIES: HsmA family protein [unclassified Isoptericola]|uniref:HsmA family protein n=1 Tax=unclassified Isoptericola TaxID=2623355 RepID=UPI00364BA68B
MGLHLSDDSGPAAARSPPSAATLTTRDARRSPRPPVVEERSADARARDRRHHAGPGLLYTVGVWAERLQGTLKPWHAVAFGVGLVCDATGTALMSPIADTSDGPASAFDTVMIWTGGLAIALMAVHLVWAVVVLVRDREAEKASFHRFSIVVWAIWLVPYVTGAIGAMTAG